MKSPAAAPIGIQRLFIKWELVSPRERPVSDAFRLTAAAEPPTLTRGQSEFVMVGRYMGIGLAVGLALGAAIGAALRNLAIGIALGAGIGVSLGASLGAAARTTKARRDERSDERRS